MAKLLIPVFCIFHMTAILWWTLPNSFGSLALVTDQEDSAISKFIKWTILADTPTIASLFNQYIDVTGSQQYWDFFAPHSTRYHQYLSVCASLDAESKSEKIICKGQPLFTNLTEDFDSFKVFGSDRSRLYRLTENLIKLDQTSIPQTFTRYYRDHPKSDAAGVDKAYLVRHQFELHPELKELPKVGYREDKVLLELL